jgi:hypothetical protein
MLFDYIKEMLTTLLPLRIILPSRRFFSSLVSSTSSSTRFMYSSYPNSLPSICLPSFKRRSNFWFTAFSRTSNGKDMGGGKENTLFKTIPYTKENERNITEVDHRFEGLDPRTAPMIVSLWHRSMSHLTQVSSIPLDRFLHTRSPQQPMYRQEP